MSNHLRDLAPDPTCASERDSLSVALDVINDRWLLHVVRAVAFGSTRYTDILRKTGAPRDVLSSRLKKLMASGILQAHSPEKGRLSGYKLTPKGQDLSQVVLVLKRWGDSYREDDVVQVDFVHEPCGEVFVAQVCCEACSRPFHAGELSAPDEC